MPKRILFIVTQSEMGGAQRFLVALAKYLAAKKYDIIVAFGTDGDKGLQTALDSFGVRTRQIDSLARNISPLRDLSAIFKIRSLIKEYRPDTLFLLSSKAGFIGSLAAKLSAKNYQLKTIYRIGGWTFNDPWPKWQKKLWLKLEKISAKWKDVIIVNNRFDFDQAKQFRISPKQELKLIYNGIDTYSAEALPKEQARQEISDAIERQTGKKIELKTVVGTIANFYPAKGLEYLIKTASYFSNGSDVSFVIIGGGAGKEKLETLIKSEKLENRVFLAGPVRDASRLMPAFDVFAMSSLKEGFPWALIEAMAARLPVVATAVGAVPEIIEDGKNGFIVEKANPGQMAKRIKEILAGENLRRELGIQAHQTVLFKFTESKMLKETEAVL